MGIYIFILIYVLFFIFIYIYKIIPKPYSVQHFLTCKDFVYPFIKFIDTDTEVIEHFEGSSYKSGVWIDVFPLDGTFTNLNIRKIHFEIVLKLRFLFQLKTRKYVTPGNKKYKFLYYVKKIIKPVVFALIQIIPKNILFNLMDFSASYVRYTKSKYLGNLYTTIKTKASHKKEIFDKKILLEFDKHYLYGPIGYDQYLTNLYGDYMTPPPENERKQHNIQILK